MKKPDGDSESVPNRYRNGIAFRRIVTIFTATNGHDVEMFMLPREHTSPVESTLPHEKR